jgi:hypothetical protein
MKTELTQEEFIYFAKTLKDIEYQLPHPIDDFVTKRIYWDDGDSFIAKTFGGTLASFNWAKPDIIIISDVGKFSKEMMVSSIAHELHHAWQYKKYGPLYFLMSIPVLRQKLLEKTAIEVEKAADKAMGMEGLRDGDPDKSGL